MITDQDVCYLIVFQDTFTAHFGSNCVLNEEPEELIRYAALIHNSVMTATSTEQWGNVMPCEWRIWNDVVALSGRKWRHIHCFSPSCASAPPFALVFTPVPHYSIRDLLRTTKVMEYIGVQVWQPYIDQTETREKDDFEMPQIKHEFWRTSISAVSYF
jgi:hypothetical protein